MEKHKQGTIMREEMDMEISCSHECPNLAAFLKHHGDDVSQLKGEMKKLLHNHKIELLRQLLGCDSCKQILIDEKH